MSINGLDASEVNDAYQSALAEGGGWYLIMLILVAEGSSYML